MTDAVLAAGDWAALANWAGQHGLAVYAGTLALLLMATGLVGQRWARDGAAHTAQAARTAAGAGASAGRAPRCAASRSVGTGLAVSFTAAGLFGLTAWQVGAGSRLSAADGLFLQALSPGVSPAVRQCFATLSHAADTATLTAACIAGAVMLAARRPPLLAAAWVLAIAGNGVLNTSLKQAFGRLRPPHLAGFLAEPGLSFPSGHSSGAVVACGMAAYLAMRLLPARWHLPALLLAVALAFSIGASRVVLQVHFASDVLAGLASGTAWLALCVTGLAVVHRAERKALNAF